MGFTRSRLVALYEAHKDHEDNIRYLEKEFSDKEQGIHTAVNAEVAEKFFVEGLKVLERIDAAHRNFHRVTVQSLRELEVEGVEETSKQCTVLVTALGLESETARVQRIKEERLAAALAAAELAAKKGRGKEVKCIEELLEEMEEHEESDGPSYQTITADDGELYYIVSDIQLGDQPPATEANEQSTTMVSTSVTQTPKTHGKKKQPGGAKEKLNLSAIGNRRTNSKRSMTRSGRQSAQDDATLSPQALELSTSPFIQVYKQLLRKAMRGDDNTCEEIQNPGTPSDAVTISSETTTVGQGPLLFVAAVDEWRGMLRFEVLNWAVRLRQVTVEYLNKQCSAKKAEIDAETNKVLRQNRRRPATLQAGSHELRVRELECAVDSVGKLNIRIRHMSSRLLETCAEAAGSNDCSWAVSPQGDLWNEGEDKLFEQLDKLRGMASTATSMRALTSQERTFTHLVTSTLEQREASYTKTVDSLVKQEEALLQATRSYLRGFGIILPDDIEGVLTKICEILSGEGPGSAGNVEDKSLQKDSRPTGRKKKKVKSEQVAAEAESVETRKTGGEENSESVEIMKIMLETANEVKRVKEIVMDRHGKQVQRVEEERAKYMVVYQQNASELQVLSRLQELIAQLKLQMHSLITQSEVKEASIDSMLRELEGIVLEEPTMHAFNSRVRHILNNEYSGDSQAAGKGKYREGNGPELVEIFAKHVEGADRELTELLSGVTADIQNEIRKSEVTNIFRLIDKMRSKVYVRGRSLDCLQNGIEIFNVPADEYVERQSPSNAEIKCDDGHTAATNPSDNQPVSPTRPHRRTRTGASPVKA
ncbi:unnamed protein product, partial [Trypanosoma congolense IL3000]